MELRSPKRNRRTGSDAGRPLTPAALLDGVTGGRRKAPTSRRDTQPRRESALRKLMNSWWDRLLGGVSDRSFSAQEAQYASHRTKRDFMWNSIGLGAWGMVFPLLTIIVTQLVGLELAGMFSLAFVTATLLMIVANYGVRTFQVSDLDESHSFADYQVSRWITCAAMIVIGLLYCNVRGYTGDMFLISIGVYLYKMVDGLADVYEGRLQQMDKLYLAGISQTIRSVSVLVIFSLVLLITRNLGGAAIAMGVTAIVSFVIVTAPLALFETPASRRANFASVKRLFVECAPLFVALFLYAFIDNMPKFAMEGVLSYDNQLFFNALYFPAQAILMTVGLIYKPLLVKMAAAWADVEHRNRFDLFIIVMVVVILAITGVGAFLMNWIGIPIMSFLYGTDFEPYRQLSLIMLAAGGVTGIIDFLYQVITVLRKQKVVMRLYLMTFLCSLFVPILMINMTGLTGAVMSYLVLMSILLVLLLWEYISVRIEYIKNPEAEEPMTDVPLGDTSFSDNALMVQNGSMYWGAYPAAYTGVKPAQSSGEGRARREATAAKRAERQARRAAEQARRAAERERSLRGFLRLV
ncbi:MAG: lipopolysaccharide biosynthesis protein, partial [Coriobacteriia bacterium]|nr:lipopolysaccharide biosynthesis protein [Coriobacteriia bacterium]